MEYSSQQKKKGGGGNSYYDFKAIHRTAGNRILILTLMLPKSIRLPRSRARIKACFREWKLSKSHIYVLEAIYQNLKVGKYQLHPGSLYEYVSPFHHIK